MLPPVTTVGAFLLSRQSSLMPLQLGIKTLRIRLSDNACIALCGDHSNLPANTVIAYSAAGILYYRCLNLVAETAYPLPAFFFTVALTGIPSGYGLPPRLRSAKYPTFGIYSLPSRTLTLSGIVNEGVLPRLEWNLGLLLPSLKNAFHASA